MESARLPRREREKLRQRQEILMSARDLFSQKGYHNVSMHEVAETAEFAIGTLYRFFENKEALYKALVLEQSDRFYEAITLAIEEPEDDVEKLLNYIRIRIKRFRDNLAFVRLMLAERRGVSFNLKAGLDEELRKRHFAFLEKLASIFEHGFDSGRFRRTADSLHLAAALDSTVDAFLLLWYDSPERHRYPEDPQAILDIFIKGMVES